MSSAVGLVAERVIDISDSDSGSVALTVVEQYSGPDSHGVGLTVVTATSARVGSPKNEDMRRLHALRLGKKAFPLVVAVTHEGQTWITGPGRDTAPIGPIETSQAQRILQAGLDEPDGISGRQRVTHLLRSLEANGIPGLSNSGLFANYFLTARAPELREWEDAAKVATPVLGLRGDELLGGLGYRIKRATSSAHILSSADSRDALSIAVVLTDEEAFEHSSTRFVVSPIAYGLRLANEHRAPWLIALRGSQIRIYPAIPGVGVGSRGQATTFFELDLALLDSNRAGYLGLVFAADALKPDGLINLLLAGSERYATSLGERLRDRVYKHAVPKLAMAVARDLERLGHTDLDKAYEVTLRILFRFLFQAYAEDGELLPYGRNDRYTRNSLKKWAQDFVDEPDLADRLDPVSTAMWRDFLQVWEVIDTGNSTWEVPPYNGGLFGSDPKMHSDGALIAQLKLTDDTVGDAVFHLLVDEMDEGGMGAVDFRSLSVREFGTIYEGLLESELSRTDIDITLDNRDVFVPAKDGDDVVVHAGEVYFHNKSGERKATGSYFTPAFAVQHLIDRALVPTLDRHLEEVAELLKAGDESGAYRKFFDFRVADLAMGSGHFLVAAIDQIEAQMAAFLVDHPVPGVTNELRRLEKAARDALGDEAGDYDIEPQSLLRRQIARRCVYGLDINPIAVELARVGIWIHTFVPGLPMSSLDHNLVCANSLTGVGTIDEALDALEPGTNKTCTPQFLRQPIEQALGDAKDLLSLAADSAEATKAEVDEAAEIARRAAHGARKVKQLFDAAIAARIGKIDLSDVFDIEAVLQRASDEGVVETVADLDPAHMPFLFPEVFLRDSGGFDVLIGNPPWDKVRFEAQQFWVTRWPGLNALSSEEREAKIAELRTERPAEAALEEAERIGRERQQVVFAGLFDLQGRGHLDLAKLFVERALNLIAVPHGRIGFVLPRQALVLGGWSKLRAALFAGSEVLAYQCRNTRGWLFDDVHHSFMVVMLVRGPTDQPGVTVWNAAKSRRDLSIAGAADGLSFGLGDLGDLSDTLVVPWFENVDDLSVFAAMRLALRLSSGKGWFNGVSESRWDFSGSGKHRAFVSTEHSAGSWRILMARHVDNYTLNLEKAFQRLVPQPEDLVSLNRGVEQTGMDVALSAAHPVIVFRYASRSDDARTLIAAALPRSGFLPSTGYVHTVRSMVPVGAVETMALLAYLNSFTADWWIRRFVDRHVTAPVINNLPLPDWDEEERQRAAGLASEVLAREGTTETPVGAIVDRNYEVKGMQHVQIVAEVEHLVASAFGFTFEQLRAVLHDFSDKGCPPEIRAAILSRYRAGIR